jgi:CheY-like chemotaxis protein
MFDFSGQLASVGTLASSTSGVDEQESTKSSLPTVLLVDDDPDSLVLLSFILESFPCKVICERDGEAALERLQQEKCDLVMLDVQLPGLSGLDVARILRSNPMNATLPIVAVTALARSQDRAKILQAGCNRYISKPYLVEDIEALINQYITRSS